MQNFLQGPDPELEVMDPDPKLDLNLTVSGTFCRSSRIRIKKNSFGSTTQFTATELCGIVLQNNARKDHFKFFTNI
jgi:hypothetical protein